MQQSENLVNNEASGLSKMLTEKKDEEMRSLFKLFHRVPETLEHIARKLSQYIIYHGSALNNLSESRKNENMVQSKHIPLIYRTELTTFFLRGHRE